jgi:integrase
VVGGDNDERGRARIRESGGWDIEDVWAHLLRRATIRYRRPHTLRHSYASLLIEAGDPSRTCSSNSATTPPPSP